MNVSFIGSFRSKFFCVKSVSYFFFFGMFIYDGIFDYGIVIGYDFSFVINCVFDLREFDVYFFFIMF